MPRRGGLCSSASYRLRSQQRGLHCVMQLTASDPEGDPIIVEWFCESGSYLAPIANQGSTSASCSPGYIYPDPITVYAKVSDGHNEVFSDHRQLYMLEFLH